MVQIRTIEGFAKTGLQVDTYKTLHIQNATPVAIFECVVLIQFVEFFKTFLASRQALELLYSLHYFFWSHDRSFLLKNLSEVWGWFSEKPEKCPSLSAWCSFISSSFAKTF